MNLSWQFIDPLRENCASTADATRRLRCFWCDEDFERLTDDHIVPQSLGGTLEFRVRACTSCQTRLSKAEREVARKSILAIHALASPVRAESENCAKFHRLSIGISIDKS